MRTEEEIFRELEALCSSRGYVHAIAFFCFHYNHIGYSDEVKAEHLQKMFGAERLIRSEISTLIGLLVRHEIDFTLPPQTTLGDYIERTEALLQELHSSMSAGWFAGLDMKMLKEGGLSPFTAGSALREPIFYGGESAYSFQYRDLAQQKYAADADWFLKNKGFTIETATRVASGISNIQNRKVMDVLRGMKGKDQSEWTLLPGFMFTVAEVASESGVDTRSVSNVLETLSLPAENRNNAFRSISDFNNANAVPLIRCGQGDYILFQFYSVVEALYESPFYWMVSDKAYVATAMTHRGAFTEQFSRDCMNLVFGAKNVFINVNIYSGRDRIGEIDVLVLFGNRAIVLQAKSKRLTLEARKGNDGQIQKDFKGAIQDSYDQGLTCAKALENPGGYSFRTNSDDDISVPPLKQIYLLCVISDHYPALAFQARQFLKYEQTKTIPAPLVLDVFALDAMTEMLQSPLYLLSYISRRCDYVEKAMASHELTLLAYHLKQNLWIEDDHHFALIGDDVSADLDVAMMSRREGLPGEKVPQGILTYLVNSPVGSIVSEIESKQEAPLIDLGFFLLTLSQETVETVNVNLKTIRESALADGKPHNFVMSVKPSGITIHCNRRDDEGAVKSLISHCEFRKYSQHAAEWFGLRIDPGTGKIRNALHLEYEWIFDEGMELQIKERSIQKR